MPAGVDIGLAARDLFDGAADVHRAGFATGFALPGNGPVQRPVDLANAGAVPEAAHCPAVARGQAVAGHARELARSDIQQDRPGRGQLVKSLDPGTRGDRTAELGQLSGHRRDQPTAAAFDHRPAGGVRQHHQREAEGARQRRWTAAATSGRPRRRAVPAPRACAAAEPGRWRAAVPRCRTGRRASSLSGTDRSGASASDRTASLSRTSGSIRRSYAARSAPSRPAVSATEPLMAPARPPSSGCATRHLGRQQAHAAGSEIGAEEERRRGRQRVHGRADVVGEAGQGELGGPAAAAWLGAPSKTCTRRPARASVSAPARPFGPEPTTTASGWLTGRSPRRRTPA